MKFSHYNDLFNYLKDKNKDINIRLEEIYDGGSSYNFRLHTTKNDYFLKLIEKSSQARIAKTMAVLPLFYSPKQLQLDEFTVRNITFNIIFMPYIDGHKLTAKQFTPQKIIDLQIMYKKLNNLKILDKYIYPQFNIIQMKNDIDELLKNSSDITYKMIDYLFWRKFKRQIIALPPSTQIIHGDLTMKNILLDSSNCLHLVDFELLRRGYITEDWAMLMLQLSGFSKLWGSVKQLKNFYKQMQCVCSDSQQWLYGIQIYYMERLRRRLTDKRKKHNLRKNLCFLCSMMRYFTVLNVFISAE
ncbi:MAG: aminoglycoside phosphotransferase family protein [Alphaproteobacteria bacterium]|nr:aminoglycoside phosphotransferase family protein [Alphaproteobacteria bacterium]